MKFKKVSLFLTIIIFVFFFSQVSSGCLNECNSPRFDENCKDDPVGQDSYTLHMSVHPHLDAYWIFDLQSYYDPKPNQGDVHGYFRSNRFNSVKQIFNTITKVLQQSKSHRETHGKGSQKAHRSFFNSQMGFFKKWYYSLDSNTKATVKQLLGTKYWEIMGGGFVQHDQGCAYYDDIIENFQTGLSFLKEQFNYFPKAAVSADSFGHSQTTLAILAHLGIEGFFVQRSDEHILLQNKTEFIWKAKSANNQFYGALPTHIRWAIHGFQDQFIGSNINENMCSSKQNYINNLRRQNEFLKRILHSNHIMRYFGHDFQQFNEYSYTVLEGMMQKFSSEKCNKVTAVYGNPTQYFMTLMGEVFGQKKKLIATREEDIMPIWDYDSGLYWTGYYTTDPYHKKNYRDTGRFLHAVRKFLVPQYLLKNGKETLKDEYEALQVLAQQVAYLQHHDGISGTSKYKVMDELQIENQNMINKIKSTTLKSLFELQFDQLNTTQNHFCFYGKDCALNEKSASEIYLKVFNSAGYKRQNEPIVVQLPFGKYYQPDCPYQINCLCQEIPCECSLYMYPENYGTYLGIKLKLTQKPANVRSYSRMAQNEGMFSYNNSHFKIELNGKKYSIGYKKIEAESTSRSYKHLSRYGDQVQRGFSIRSGKYALGNNPNKITDLSEIKQVLLLESTRNTFILLKWKREAMKTFITINKEKSNQWNIQTLSAAQGYHLEDLYLQVETEINNEQKFYTDSNGWLVMKRQLFHHEDYEAHFDPNKYDDVDGNSYPMTAFTFIQDNKDKVSINTDRPQGVIAYRPGTLWVNFDRLSADDGKWVYQTTYRSDYQRFSHVVTVQNTDNNQRKVQALYDMPVLTQINYLKEGQTIKEVSHDHQLQNQWIEYSGLKGLKTLIKPINDSTIVVRIHNLHDTQSHKVILAAGNVSPLLTALYGNEVGFSNVVERSLGNNMDYQEFLQRKWNWNDVVDLKNQNNIFNKVFGEELNLRPLQIRTFSFSGIKILEDCGHPSALKRSSNTIKYEIDLTKAAPKRQDPIWERQVTQYMLHGDHCSAKSPIIIDKRYDQSVENPVKPVVQKPKDDQFFVPLVIQDQTGTVNTQRTFQKLTQNNRPGQLSLDNIKKKVLNTQTLTKQEKLIYFQNRLKDIVEWNAQHSGK